VSCHVLGDRGLPKVDSELEEFSVNPRSAPEWVGEADVADQLANFDRKTAAVTKCATSLYFFHVSQSLAVPVPGLLALAATKEIALPMLAPPRRCWCPPLATSKCR